MTCIYLLLDPRTAEVRYVGWTSQELIARLRMHRSEAGTKSRTHKSRWIRNLFAANAQPVIWLLETTEDYQERERYWIAHYRAAGCRLVNGTDGGDGRIGLKHSAETRALISATKLQRGYRTSEATKAKLRAVNLGLKHGPHSESTKQKISAVHAGERHHFAKLTWKKVRAIREEAAGQRLGALAVKYGVDPATVSDVVNGRTWKEPGMQIGSRGPLRGEDASRAKLTWVQVNELRKIAPQFSRHELAARYGISLPQLDAIIAGKKWKDARYQPPGPRWHTHTKLTWEKVRTIRAETPGQQYAVLAERYKISRSTVGKILNHQTWKEHST